MWKLRVSSSVIPFREKAEKVWGLERYKSGDYNCDLFYMGMYHIGDYQSFLFHRGKIAILWCGSDILQLGWWKYLIRLKKADHYCENEVEQEELKKMGIKAEVKPSFLEDVNDFPVSFKSPIWNEKPRVFLSTNAGRENEYGFGLVKKLAERLPDIDFHLFGSNKWETDLQNIICHGIVPPDQFNREIKNYHCGLRTNKFDGFSEIIAKSALLGQYPISRIKYPMIDNYETEEELVRLLKGLKDKKEPNIKARVFWRNNINQYPFLWEN